MGKRKIEIKKIQDRQQRSVTLTKRRDGLFKKAETACLKFGGLQIGIIVFSPAGKPFTFCNSSSVSLDAIIDTYMSSNSSSMVMGKRSRDDDDDDDVQVIETDKKKQKTILMNDAAVVTPPPPCITVQEEEDKLDQGFHWDHNKNIVSDQEELRNYEFMGSGKNDGIVTEEEMTSQFLVEDDTYSELQEIINVNVFEYADHHHHHRDDETTTMGLYNSTSASASASDMNEEEEEEVGGADKYVALQEIINIEDDFEYDDHHHHHSDETTTMGLIPPPPPPPPHTTSTTSTSLCDLMTASDINEEEVLGGANEDDFGYTLEEWEQIFSTSPSSDFDNSTSSDSYMNQEGVVQAHWPSQEFLQLLRS